MAVSETYKVYHRTAGAAPLAVIQSTESIPKNLGANDVLIKIHSVSLNYRDAAMIQGTYPGPVLEKGIPASDAAAEVVAVGSAVQQLKAGDHVSPNFVVNFLTGDETEPLQALGGDIDGVLGERHRMVQHWRLEEPVARTQLCTGGVSMFALLLLIDSGIKTIITSSSDAKIAQIQKLSPLITGVNYKTHPDISAEVQRITNGRGVDIVVNNIGPASIPSNIDSIQAGGSVSIVGFLGGLTADWNPSELLKLLFKRGVIRGIAVGTKLDFEALCAHLANRKIALQPLVDRVFAFDEVKDGLDYMWAGRHVGKVIVKVAE
ncbi:hypothetical protein TARUN_4352 [Trichoderma arundinaceum]|uniref:Enoyl reductase (ER) domain-containing protein n=1 Tax=Trichoderma arundinaceum TaxID=490622 RepID=A0A395NPM2_TRIAR|nr:hypothetical protein TARUN_4352 [Trichoderma arundinaceum]